MLSKNMHVLGLSNIKCQGPLDTGAKLSRANAELDACFAAARQSSARRGVDASSPVHLPDVSLSDVVKVDFWVLLNDVVSVISVCELVPTRSHLAWNEVKAGRFPRHGYFTVLYEQVWMRSRKPPQSELFCWSIDQ